MASLRRVREEDTEDDQRWRERSGGGTRTGLFNGHTKWVVGAFGSLLITALVGLAVRDRNVIDKDQARQDAQVQAMQNDISHLRQAIAEIVAVQTGTNADVRSIKESVQRIDTNVEAIRRNTQ